jgi:hypothetical protein
MIVDSVDQLIIKVTFATSTGIFAGSTAKNKKKHLCVLGVSACPTCPTCPMKSLLPLFHRG